MSHEPFDLERLRRNWERAGEPEAPMPRARDDKRGAPLDSVGEAWRLLTRIKELVLANLSAHRGALMPFLERAEALLARMGTSDEPDDALRDELLAVLVDLEDLADVFGAAGR